MTNITDIKPSGKLASIGAEDLRKRLIEVAKERQIAVQDHRELPENRGGVLGGLGYVAEKVGAGFMQGIEGVWDYAAGGIADAVGNDAWAEEQVGTSWFPEWYDNIDKKFNPSEGWRTAGDIGGAIGSSLPALVPSALVAGGAALATIGSGGTAAPVTVPAAVTIISGMITAGMSAGGQAVSEAYKQTGKLTGKEWGYATAVAATEAGIELASMGLGAGTGKVVKALLGSATPATKVAARTGAKKIVGGVLRAGGSLAKDFAAEALEEGTAEIMSPIYARMTIDPNADLATIDEVAYSAFVGGISGVLFGGVGSAVNAGQNIAHNTSLGRQSVQNGTAKAITDTAKIIAEAERKRPSGYDLFQRIEKAYKAIEGTEEKDYTAKQMRKLGELEVLTSAARFLPEIEASAINAVMNAQEVAQRFSGIGVQKDGKPITAEDIYVGLVGVNPSTQEGITKIRKALSTNPTLIAVSVADATGRMMLDSSNPTGGVAAQGMSAEAYKALQGSKSAPAVATQMGLGNSLANVDYTAFTEAAKRYAQTESGRKYVKGVSAAKRAANALRQNTDALPEKVDGTKRYGQYAFIEKDGRYRVYDYVQDVMSFEMTKEEAQAFLDRLNAKSADTKAESAEEKKPEKEKPAQAEEAKDDGGKVEEKPKETTAEAVKRVKKEPTKETPTEKKTTKAAEVSRKKNGVIYEGFSFNEKNATNMQKATIAAAEFLHKFTPSVEVHVYQTVMDGDKRVVKVNGQAVTELGGVNVANAPNGFFTNGNHIYIDINATRGGKQVSLYTLSHEITHYIHDNALGSYNKIAEFLWKKYGKKGAVFAELQKAKKEALKKQYADRKQTPPDDVKLSMLATEELVADSMSHMLADESFYDVLEELGAQDATAKKSFTEALKHALEKLKGLLQGVKKVKTADAGDLVSAFPQKAYKQLQKLYAEAIMDAETHAAKNTDTKFSYGDDIDSDGLSQYNEIVLESDELGRLQSEGMTWKPNERGTLRSVALSNGITYRYVLDADGIVHCYGRKPSENIHERKEKYGVKGRRRPDRAVESIRLGYDDDGVDSGSLRDRREQAHDDSVDHRVLRQARDNQRADHSKNGSALDRGQEEVTSKTKYDRQYLAAVERGDMEKAREFILNAAEAAGYTTPGYHGTHASAFTEFKRGRVGIFLASKRSVAEMYAGKSDGHVFDLVAKLNKPYVVKADINLQPTYADSIPVPDEMAEDGYSGNVSVEDIALFAKGKGYDGVIIEGVIEDGGIYTSDIVVFDPRQVKSTETVTYDDNGEIIPPSERFNDRDPDIRYSERDTAGSVIEMTAPSVYHDKSTYKPTRREKAIDLADRTYAELFNAQVGVEKALRGMGMSRAEAEAEVQYVRAAGSAAQTMIDTHQVNTFGGKYEVVGKGLLDILKPTRHWSAEKKADFDLYLLLLLNQDRMSLERRTTAQMQPKIDEAQGLAERIAELRRQEKGLAGRDGYAAEVAAREQKIADADAKLKAAKAERRSLDNELVRLSKKGTAESIREKKAAIRAVEKRIEEITAEKAVAKEGLPLLKQKAKKYGDITLAEVRVEIREKTADLAALNEEIKAGIIQDKPVFDVNEDIGRDHAITEAESKEAASSLAEKYPEFVKIAESIHGYSRNLLQMRVDAGLITQEQMDRMQELYPHYVPSYRDIDAGYGFVPVRGKGAMAISSTVKRAKGGGQNILRISDILAGQTTEVMRAGRLNELMNLLYPDIEEDTDSTADALPDEEGDKVLLKPTNGQVTFFRNGKAVTVKTPDGITLALEDLRTPSVDTKNPIERALAFGMKLFRGGVTTYNPVFSPKNAARDLQDAGINSKHAKEFYAILKTAAEQIAKNGEYWQEYRAMGGFSSSVFQDTLAADSGYAGFASIAGMFEKGDFTPNGLKKMFKTLGKSAKALCIGVENLNNFVEQVPRLAEYIASRKAGDSIKVAMNNSAEVTTNFGRHGRTSKKLNAILIPFLNANLQGFDKMFRNASEAVTSTQVVRSVARLITKAVLIGMVPMLLNMLMYDDDEEYKSLRDADKENYFLIKVSDESFIRIPRGRVASVIGGALRRTVKAAKGEDPDIKGYLENVSTQISPVESLSRDIFSPIRDAASNQTWYGSRIEGMEFEDTKPRDRYDESTSSIAIALGKLFNTSPKKLHYVLDQYSGVIGDLLLPATSGKENKGLFSGNLTVDTVLSARWTTDFYDLYEKTNYKKTEGDEQAAYVIRYLNRVKKSVKVLNDEIDAVRAGDGSNVEKLKQVRAIRALINAEYKAALDSVENVRAAVAATDGIENETLRDAEVTRIVFGAESALRNYDGNVYAKYAPLAEAGVSFDDIYDFYFSTLLIESDRDSTGEVVQGSKKRKVLDLLREMDIPVKQKILLAEAKGYKVSANDLGN